MFPFNFIDVGEVKKLIRGGNFGGEKGRESDWLTVGAARKRGTIKRHIPFNRRIKGWKAETEIRQIPIDHSGGQSEE